MIISATHFCGNISSADECENAGGRIIEKNEKDNSGMRIWGKLMKNNRLLKDMVVENYDYTLNRTKKVYQALEEMCYEFDLAKPIWLDSNKDDFIRHSRTKFTKDSFVEDIDFDFLDFQVIEEDY